MVSRKTICFDNTTITSLGKISRNYIKGSVQNLIQFKPVPPSGVSFVILKLYTLYYKGLSVDNFSHANAEFKHTHTWGAKTKDGVGRLEGIIPHNILS